MSKRWFVMAHAEARRRAAEAVQQAPDGYIVEVKEQKRTDLQNRKFHGICADLARSRFLWAGKPRDAAQWKCLLVSGHAVATKEGADFTAGLEGEYINLRESTALMSKRRGASLIEYALAFASQNGIHINDLPDHEQ